MGIRCLFFQMGRGFFGVEAGMTFCDLVNSCNVKVPHTDTDILLMHNVRNGPLGHMNIERKRYNYLPFQDIKGKEGRT